MFIQYHTNEVVNISRIERIQMFEKNIRFKLIGGNEWFTVECRRKDQFMNHLQAMTNNLINIEQLYYKIKDGEK